MHILLESILMRANTITMYLYIHNPTAITAQSNVYS